MTMAESAEETSGEVSRVTSIPTLFVGSSFLLFAGGLNGLIPPKRGAVEGFSAASLGLLGTG
jgi:hypothetical protein